ncbi:unnamed protein product [Closterium sp. NIES-54]
MVRTLPPRRPTLRKPLTKLLGRRGLARTLLLLPLATARTSPPNSSTPTATTAAATTPTSATTATTTPTAATTAATEAPTPATTPTVTSATSTASTASTTTTPTATSTTLASLALAATALPTKSRSSPDVLITKDVNSSSRSVGGGKGGGETPLKEGSGRRAGSRAMASRAMRSRAGSSRAVQAAGWRAAGQCGQQGGSARAGQGDAQAGQGGAAASTAARKQGRATRRPAGRRDRQGRVTRRAGQGGATSGATLCGGDRRHWMHFSCRAEPRRPAEPRHPTELHCPTCTAPVTTAASTATAATAATAANGTMASPTVLTFDAKGRAVDFDVWVDDLQLFLQCDSRDGVSLFDHTSGVSTAPAATADIARYSSPAITALSRLMLPYLFPHLAAFATVADLIAHLRTSDARYRVALPTEFCAKNPPPPCTSPFTT